MRILLIVLSIVGVALLTVGALVPERFVLALLGLVILTGTASAALASLSPRRPPYPRY
ncbi:hypothetical protein [Blastococcus xanthinilyticus]|uniref:Uncharacterized protein n=1 Tax=Blastococcus xanthinilyticus TaxID=1564164 RepID=A0A5S5CMS9_9ACTN|nr:hypothetical protein [Blastococcus xanthinilyticus]TYP83701.1 hypothetical protein BD833_11659 [Blastococcus xanthinilyticus]